MPVLAFSCTHAPATHPKFLPFLKRVHKKYKCTRVVHAGDLVDWNAISFHEKDPSMPSAEDEYIKAFKQVQGFYKAFPKLDYIMGNHCSLPARKARLVGLPTSVMLPFAQLWGVEGWDIHPRFSDVVIDGVIYRHGDKGKGGINAASKNAVAENCSLVQGHLHAQGGVVYHSNQGGQYFGVQVGCGTDPDHPAMDYSRIYSAKPVLGCSVIYDRHRADFIPMPL